ncbi:hypothetical protein [Limnohabitans sp.]|uniref:hypothetical protein n=1 Tax=Limnohabitans sp. TaxID=1907725 RepID=UPI0025BB7865|nr:hypothetical protein [Limnohabitans sp.]
MVEFVVQWRNDSFNKSKNYFVLSKLSLVKNYDPKPAFKLLAMRLSVRQDAWLVGHGAGRGLFAQEPSGAVRGRDPHASRSDGLVDLSIQSGSPAVTQALEGLGFTNIRHVHGGRHEWAKRGWLLVKPENLEGPSR